MGAATPEDGLKTLPAEDGQRITLTATGHAGYEPGALTEAALAYSYDEGATWTDAATERQRDGTWRTTVNHSGTTGKQVTPKSVLTDANGTPVTRRHLRLLCRPMYRKTVQQLTRQRLSGRSPGRIFLMPRFHPARAVDNWGHEPAGGKAHRSRGRLVGAAVR
jgi:hypothetical protein